MVVVRSERNLLFGILLAIRTTVDEPGGKQPESLYIFTSPFSASIVGVDGLPMLSYHQLMPLLSFKFCHF